ncbi:MAG TPA: hypothetical protein VFI23_15195 [Rhizomicrobium sp.]|nr:hypothetical protein [Rhizomicrobium sp.]
MDWLSQLPGTVQPFLDAVGSGLALAYGWAKEWQVLLAGCLVLLAALIVARAIRKRPVVYPAEAVESPKADLRVAEKPALSDSAASPQELVGSLEQLRSIIRSALASFTLTTATLAENESSPSYFLCQRIAHLGLERFPLPINAGKTAREQHAALLQQLELLRVHLRKNAPPTEISEILVRLNASARNLAAALTPAPDPRRKAGSEPR